MAHRPPVLIGDLRGRSEDATLAGTRFLRQKILVLSWLLFVLHRLKAA